ncbi:hypothetical protein BaRGS_00032618 [Batillaria attramentaria]|uniref:Zonadhesin n=1 Tax=Batillaria attramentaria TaxID=370345 RepID=A0ABD0JN78_9CAEN
MFIVADYLLRTTPPPPQSVCAERGSRLSLSDAALQAEVINCTETVSYSIPVVQTAYVTVTPDVQTEHVTLAPEIQTEYVTITPGVLYVTQVETDYVTITPDNQIGYVTVTAEAETAYVTLTPEVLTAYVTITPDAQVEHVTVTEEANTAYVTVTPEVSTAYVTITPSPVIEHVTVTNEIYVTEHRTAVETQVQTVEISQSCSVVTSMVEVDVTPTLTETVTVSAAASCPLAETSTVPTCAPVSVTRNNSTAEDILVEMHQVVKELTVDRSNISRIRRMKESAPDDRTSATTMGLSASLFLFVCGLLVFLLDAPKLHRDIMHFRRNVERKPGTKLRRC